MVYVAAAVALLAWCWWSVAVWDLLFGVIVPSGRARNPEQGLTEGDRVRVLPPALSAFALVVLSALAGLATAHSVRVDREWREAERLRPATVAKYSRPPRERQR